MTILTVLVAEPVRQQDRLETSRRRKRKRLKAVEAAASSSNARSCQPGSVL